MLSKKVKISLNIDQEIIKPSNIQLNKDNYLSIDLGYSTLLTACSRLKLNINS